MHTDSKPIDNPTMWSNLQSTALPPSASSTSSAWRSLVLAIVGEIPPSAARDKVIGDLEALSVSLHMAAR